MNAFSCSKQNYMYSAIGSLFQCARVVEKNQFYKQTSNFEWPKGHTLFQINTFKKH